MNMLYSLLELAITTGLTRYNNHFNLKINGKIFSTRRQSGQ